MGGGGGQDGSFSRANTLVLECGGALRDERRMYIRRYREHQQRIFYDPGTPTIKIAARRLENRSADADSGNDAVLSPGRRSFLCSRCSRDVVFVMSLRELASAGNIKIVIRERGGGDISCNGISRRSD